MVVSFLELTGYLSCSVGGFIGIIASIKSKEANHISSATHIETLSELRHLVSVGVPLLIAITARVWCSKPVKCELSNNEGAIVEFREDLRSEKRSGVFSGVWLSETDPLHYRIKEAPWALADGSIITVHLPIVDGRNALFVSDALQVSNVNWLPAQEGVVSAVVGELTGRKVLGVRRCERFLPVGATVTVVGELSTAKPSSSLARFKGALKTADNGEILVIKSSTQGSPFIVTKKSYAELVQAMKAESEQFTSVAMWFTVFGLGCLAVSFSHRAFKAWRAKRDRARILEQRQRLQKEAQEAYEAAARASGHGLEQDGSDDAARKCVICWGRDASMVYTGCGHLCVCEPCSNVAMVQKQCPLCRKDHQSPPIKVFFT